MNWRLSLEPNVRAHLEKQVSDTSKFKESYLKAKNAGNAQLWCAIANLSKRLYELSLRLNNLEGVFEDLCKKDVKERKVKKKKKQKHNL